MKFTDPQEADSRRAELLSKLERARNLDNRRFWEKRLRELEEWESAE